MFSDDQSLNLGLSFLPSSPSNSKVPNTTTYHVQIKDNRPSLLTLSLELSAGEMFPGSAASSDSNNTSVVKRERQESSDHEEEDDRAAGPTSSATRKKLRLTKKQSLFLEDTFKQHTTLNPKQKQVLADQLSLRPRQIEVWFQNRRARTKLKQTEVECEQMKKYCDTLTDENRRLQKELQDLKALKIGQPGVYMHLPTATLATCPSCCQRTGSGSGATLPVPINLGSKTHFYPSFPNPSAAC